MQKVCNCAICACIVHTKNIATFTQLRPCYHGPLHPSFSLYVVTNVCRLSVRASSNESTLILIERLQHWHGRKNLVGNFCRCRVSSSTVVPAEFLTPLKNRNLLRPDGTPVKSCLKKISHSTSIPRRINFSLESKYDEDITPPRPTRKSAARVTFSPYNQVGAPHDCLLHPHSFTLTHTTTHTHSHR